MGNDKLRLKVIRLHRRIIGFEFDRYDTDEHKEWTYFNDNFVKAAMERYGFDSLREYVDMYPGQYRYSSIMAKVFDLEHSTLDPENKRMITSCEVFSVAMYDNTVQKILEHCIDIVVSKMTWNAEDMYIFPTVKAFKKYAPIDSLSKDFGYLWFCEDYFNKEYDNV